MTTRAEQQCSAPRFNYQVFVVGGGPVGSAIAIQCQRLLVRDVTLRPPVRLNVSVSTPYTSG